MLERLQKIISRAGIASRRRAEQLILSGAVSVNGHVVTELGTKADAASDHITVGPRVVHFEPEARDWYFVFNKPQRVVSTLNDPEGRPCLGPYLRNNKGRLFPVGRLDFDSGGALLLTSDGVLASDLMRAAGAISQTWRFKVKGQIGGAAHEAIERDAHVRLRTYREGENAWYEATLRNAPRDLLRQALGRHGILVEKMVRAGYGGIELGTLPAGEMRELTSEEVNTIRRAAQGRVEPVAQPRVEERRTQPVPPQQQVAQGRTRPAVQPRAAAGRVAPLRRTDDARRGTAKGARPWRGASGHPSGGPRRGPQRRAGSGPGQGPSRGPSHGPSRGFHRGPSSGPNRGPNHGPRRGPSQGPSRGPRRETQGSNERPRRHGQPPSRSAGPPRNHRPGGRPKGKPSQ